MESFGKLVYLDSEVARRRYSWLVCEEVCGVAKEAASLLELLMVELMLR